MFHTTINKIKNGYHHKLTFVEIVLNKNEFRIINIFLKIGVIKKVVVYKKKYILYYNYINSTNVFKIKNYYKPSNKKYIKLNTLKKLIIEKNWLLLLSTPKGVITSVEALKHKTGGLIIAKIWG